MVMEGDAFPKGREFQSWNRILDGHFFTFLMGSGRLVACDIRGPRFESSHWETFIGNEYLFSVNFTEKTKKQTRAHLYSNTFWSARLVFSFNLSYPSLMPAKSNTLPSKNFKTWDRTR